MPVADSISKMGRPAALCSLVLTLLVGIVGWNSQAQEPRKQEQPEVLRVYTELVQTDVMVFDRQGNFVNGLKREDFELRIDGKLKPIEFFEKVVAGSSNEESQIAAARGSAIRPNNVRPAPAPLDRGRPVFFYIDDLHLDLASVNATKKLVERYIDRDMGQNDEAAIASANGQIGFLQQLTDNKSVLHAAIDRLKPRPYSVRDIDRPPMTEYQALLITHRDLDATSYFVDQTLRQYPGITRESAEAQVEMRARALVQQGASVTTNTLAGLEGLVKSANKLPGRKLVIFISGGFFLDDLNSDSRFRLQRITSAAARSGIVIYSLDARGLVASLSDISSESQPDPTGRLSRAGIGELSATQDAMNALAADTGGKATFNTNNLETGLTRALKETSVYYLLAWKPEAQNQRTSKFRRIEVKVPGKPNVLVQVRRGFFDREPELPVAKNDKAKPDNTTKDPDKNAKLSPEAELRKVLAAPYPNRDIPVSLSLTFINSARGPMLTSAMQVPNEFFSFQLENGRQTAIVTVAGTIFNDRGRPGASFSNRITIDAPTIEAAREGPNLTFGYPVYLGPGLYQVRVGARDERTGRAGTAHGWIEIPNLASKQLAMSSVLMGVRRVPPISNVSVTTANAPDPVDLSIDHVFPSNGYLRFLVFVYNAALASVDSKPDLAVQLQVIRDGQPVITTPQKRIAMEDLPNVGRIPYAAEISLGGLPSGQYVLHVTIVDRIAKTSTSQQTRFEIQ